MRGCIEWQTHGLGSCEAVDASVEEYRIEVSGLEEFLESCCAFESNYKITSAKLSEVYTGWCNRNRREKEGDKAMAAALKKRNCTSGKVQGVRGWHGLALAESVPSGT